MPAIYHSFPRLFVSLLFLSFIFTGALQAADVGSGADKFAQLEQVLPSPNVYRTASGEPGPNYWQQRADYTIKVSLDEQKRRITGEQQIKYSNRSPTALRYLWIQLDQNRFDNKSKSVMSRTSRPGKDGGDALSYSRLRGLQASADRDYGFEIGAVEDADGNALPYTLVDTMMRIDLASPLSSGKSTVLTMHWAHNIIDEAALGGRGGYEHFADSDTYLYFLAQWHPRVAAFTDYTGWQHKAFLGGGEFTLEFGDFDVFITVPADHIVSSTGALVNPKDVLSVQQRERLASANNDNPVFIVTPEEALANEKKGTNKRKTWHFKAHNVRDFAWASSRKFIWDAMLHQQSGAEQSNVLAMSFYPNEAEPIWSKYSTQAVVHTMEVYSRFSFPYPYPTAQSVNTWESGGMEYPMITFNGYRPVTKKADEKTVAKSQKNIEDKSAEPTYSRAIKYSLIGVIIHEIGHIYFPMTVNSDERQWTWMDEGINSFLETLAEAEWEENFPTRGAQHNIQDYIWQYMTDPNQVPIMTQSDSILQFGNNAYAKPAAALMYLRESVMGRELFDFAFREYARRWMFKRPTPADFFRTMEDASGVDLDWFWRGWFYSTEHLDVAISDIREYQISSLDPDQEYPLQREQFHRDAPPAAVTLNNRQQLGKTRIERFKQLQDDYNKNDRFTVSNKNRNDYQTSLKALEDWELAVLERAIKEDNYIYFIDFENIGGLVTPLKLTIKLERGETQNVQLPVEIWRRNAKQVTKLWISEKKISSIALDEAHDTPDANRDNNHFPRKISRGRIELYKDDKKKRNLMAEMLVELKGDNKDEKCDCKELPLSSSN